MSVAPVPDQRLYDTIYQERYMGLPAGNAEGYKQASPINFAEGLKGNLLIVHGSGDDNVHYQGTELLVNRLVELGKPFDFMAYPDRTHAISEGPGTTPHLYHLLDALSDRRTCRQARAKRRGRRRRRRRRAAPPRPTPPTRDPNTPGYVKAKELPDGARAAGRRRRQLHHRPDAHSGAGDDRAGRRAAGHGLQLHDELGRQQDLSGHRARRRHVRHARSRRSGEARS